MTLASFLLKLGPLFVKHWKFFVGVIAGILIYPFVMTPPEPLTDSEIHNSETSNVAAATTKTAKIVVDTRIITEIFRPDGAISERTTTESVSRTDTRETAVSTTKTATVEDVRIVEKVAPRPRQARIGAVYNGEWAVSADVEVVKIGVFALDLGAIMPPEDLKRTAATASVRFPLPF